MAPTWLPGGGPRRAMGGPGRQGRVQTAQDSLNTHEKGCERPPRGLLSRNYRSNTPKMASRWPTSLPTRPKGSPRALPKWPQ
eukprot:5391470-Pyramimonas_sp.AAC.1